MGAGLYSHTTRAVGLTLTANIYNADHVNHITNHNTTQIDDYSTNAAQMQTVTDPYPGSVESLATSLSGELERIRYVIKQMSGKTHWYMDPTLVAVDYRSGLNCKFATSTTITVEGGSIDVAGTLVTKTADTTLTLTTVGDWVDDTSDQAVSKLIYIYINSTGKIELNDVAPDESDTAGNTTGLLIYNDTGTDTSDRRCIGKAYLNATGSGELTDGQVWNWQNTVTHLTVTGLSAITPDANTLTKDLMIGARCTFNGTGTPAYLEEVNFTGAITDNGTGNYTLTIDRDFANANYAVSLSSEFDATGSNSGIKNYKVKAVGSITILTYNDATAAVDHTNISVILVGQQ